MPWNWKVMVTFWPCDTAAGDTLRFCMDDVAWIYVPGYKTINKLIKNIPAKMLLFLFCFSFVFFITI